MAVERIDYQAGSVKGKGALVWNENIGGKRPLLRVMPNWRRLRWLHVRRGQDL